MKTEMVTSLGGERFVVTTMEEIDGNLVVISRFMREDRTRRLKTADIRKEAYEVPERFQSEVHDDAVELARFVRE